MTDTCLLRHLDVTSIASIRYCFQFTVTRISCQNCLQFYRIYFAAILAMALFNLFVASEPAVFISRSAFHETSIFSKLNANKVYLWVYAKTWIYTLFLVIRVFRQDYDFSVLHVKPYFWVALSPRIDCVAPMKWA